MKQLRVQLAIALGLSLLGSINMNAQTSQMNHIAITNDKGAGGVVWLKPVTDEEYNAREKD